MSPWAPRLGVIALVCWSSHAHAETPESARRLQQEQAQRRAADLRKIQDATAAQGRAQGAAWSQPWGYTYGIGRRAPEDPAASRRQAELAKAAREMLAADCASIRSALALETEGPRSESLLQVLRFGKSRGEFALPSDPIPTLIARGAAYYKRECALSATEQRRFDAAFAPAPARAPGTWTGFSDLNRVSVEGPRAPSRAALPPPRPPPPPVAPAPAVRRPAPLEVRRGEATVRVFPGDAYRPELPRGAPAFPRFATLEVVEHRDPHTQRITLRVFAVKTAGGTVLQHRVVRLDGDRQVGSRDTFFCAGLPCSVADFERQRARSTGAPPP
ncbi:MAG TPA: hypothetical protein PLR99_03590 [Polyangiaceae bacterium]|nr:hypothetical protein [Polyangiaceae bacterium]